MNNILEMQVVDAFVHHRCDSFLCKHFGVGFEQTNLSYRWAFFAGSWWFFLSWILNWLKDWCMLWSFKQLFCMVKTLICQSPAMIGKRLETGIY